MQGRPPHVPPRSFSFLILGVYTVLPLLLLAATMAMHAAGVPKPIPVIAYVIAGLALLLGVGYAQSQMGPSQSRAKFQVGMVVTLGLNEICVLIGFALGGMSDANALIPFALGSAAANLLFVLPRIIRFWRVNG
jgi:hypothetical protein